MRKRAWTAIGSAGMAVVLGLLGQATENDAVYLLSGLTFLLAIGLGLSLLPVWANLGLRLPSMPGLFPRVGPSQHWDPTTGTAQAGARPKKAGAKTPKPARRK